MYKFITFMIYVQYIVVYTMIFTQTNNFTSYKFLFVSLIHHLALRFHHQLMSVLSKICVFAIILWRNVSYMPSAKLILACEILFLRPVSSLDCLGFFSKDDSYKYLSKPSRAVCVWMRNNGRFLWVTVGCVEDTFFILLFLNSGILKLICWDAALCQ